MRIPYWAYIRKRSVTANWTEPVIYSDPAEKDVVDIDAYKQYNNALNKISSMLDTGSGDSPEFRDFRSNLNNVVNKDFLHLRFSKVEVLMSDLEGSCVRYLSHCSNKPRWGSRRAGRIEAANACRNLYGMIKEGVKDPEKRMKLDIAKKCINTFIISAKSKGAKGATIKNLENNVDQIAERMLSSEKFKKIVENKDILELSKLSHKKPSEFAKTFKGVAVTEKSMKELIKESEVKKDVQPEIKKDDNQSLVK